MDGRHSTEDFQEKLDLDAPILSTRRLMHCGNAAVKTSWGRETSVTGFRTRGSVPFLWERAPGLAKDVQQDRGSHEDQVPPPKPPPNRWHPSHHDYSDEDGISSTNDNHDNLAPNDEDGDVFTDAVDVISLSESFDRACSTAAKSSSTLTPETLKSAGNLSPNYIIRRFLPAANAIAFSSCRSTPSKNFPESNSPRPQNGHPSSKSFSSYQSTNTSSALEGGPRTMVRYYSPPKACGLEVFSPLRLKHALCGLKSPIRTSPTRITFKRRQNPTNGASVYGPKRKKEETGTKGFASEGESSVDRLDARSAPEFSRLAWLHAPLHSPAQSWRSHGHYRR